MPPKIAKRFRIEHRKTGAMVDTAGMEIVDTLKVLNVSEEDVWWVEKPNKMIGRCIRRYSGQWPVKINYQALDPDTELTVLGFRKE